MTRIFVYGTLKQGFANAHINRGVRVPGVYRTRERHTMVLLGDGHVPTLVLTPGEGHAVVGELYDVDDETLTGMDALERIGEPGGYLRVPIELVAHGDGVDATDVLVADVYVRPPEHLQGVAERIGPLAEYTLAHQARFRW